MITLAEIQVDQPTFDAADYAAIQAATGNLAVQVKLQRYGPVWASHDNGPGGSGENFDAALASTYVVWVYISGVSTIEVERLADESGGDESWVSCNTVPEIDDFDTDVPPSMATDGLAVRIFYYTTSGKIEYTESANISNTAFAVPVEVGTVANVIQLAAVSTTKIYYITKNSNNNRVFHVYEYNGSWSSTSSDIYWPFPTYGFDAVAYTDFDLLMMSSELPSLLGSRAIGTEVTTEVNRVQGLVTFRVNNGRWSNYDIVDVIDKVETDPSRDNLRLSFVNSTLFATYTRCGGADDHTYSKLAVVRSKDGLNWEFPELLETITSPAVILPRTDYLYNVGISKVMRSPCCAWAGQTPTELDVTNYVVSIDSQAAEIRNSSAAISNPAGVLDSTLARSEDRIQVVHHLGYTVGTDTLRISVSTEDVMSWQHSKRLPHQGLSPFSQDRLGRLNRITSDYAAEWPSQQAGRETYDDPTGTGYGGMRHTAPYEGSWKTPSDSPNEIHLKSSNKEGIAVSTFVTDTLNGSAQTAFKLHTDSEGEYAGITFRVFDKDNLFFVAYYLDDDAIKLVKGVGGTDSRDDTVLATSGSMSWVKDTWYWLKIRVRYSLVYVYYSADGITWTLLDTGGFSSGYAELSGVSDVTYYNIIVGLTSFSGKFGLIGYGYSDDDAGPDWIPPPWDPPQPELPPIPPNVVVWSRNQLAHTSNFNEEYPTWADIKPAAVTYISRVVMDGDGIGAWLTSGISGTSATEGVFYTPDIMASSVNWTLKLSQTAARTMALAIPHGARNDWGLLSSAASHGPGSLCVGERKWHGFGDRTGSFAFTTTDDGGSWSVVYLVFTVGGKTCRFWMNHYTWIATQQMLFDGGTIWMVGFSGNNSPYVAQVASHLTSADGASWTLTRAASVSENGLRSIGQIGGGVRAVTEDEKAYIIPGFTLVDTAVGQKAALGLAHPSSLYARATDGAGTGLWRDGAVIKTQSSIFPNADGAVLRGITPWPAPGSKLILVNGYATSNPEIVVWYKNGTVYDKTGNLITAVGSWLGNSANHDNIGTVYVLD